MLYKLIAGIVGLALLIGFLLPPIIQIKEVSLIVVVLIGIGLAAVEFYESMKKKEE
ncbi:hypothetical protein [Pseudazoarcus pumilus]|uniref:hypothetical protein n=1 Tax=Pseudazoarcus pumilus TaxID=2067960 RepID=UPI0013DCEF88|nr:hypothetical protein [Pseudazoarcus pumilus]